ncbi:TIM barrel protein [Streptomyces sp. NPDC052682]|uniref:sugar phosphate isomerase/epimerase and 4-hydroxyphenylpyruvate domain-containing protein n=1 Tax=Streptomyces sp. NPDC052682 TaxID=3154954 RepID=UPI00343B3E0D
MRRTIATVCLSGTLGEKLTAAARAGFDGVELFENDLLAGSLSPEDVRARAAALGLTIDLYQPLRDVEAAPQERFARSLRRAEHTFQVMRRLGTGMLLVCSNVSADAADDDALAARQLRTLAERAAAHGIRVAYEALAWGRHVRTYDHAWRIVEQADHPALGVCLDSFHILSRGSDPAGIEHIPAEKIFFLQLADAPLPAMDVLHWSRHHRCFPGQGGLDVARLLRHVARAGYEGPLSLEVFNDVFRQADAGRTAVDAMRSLIALEERAGLYAGTDPVVPSGIALAELSTPGPRPLTGLLEALGFVRAEAGAEGGRPQEWRQNGARLLVAGRAATRQEGTTLTGIGLGTPDPRAVLDRAEALLAPVEHRQPGAPGLASKAVVAPDGTRLLLTAGSGRTATPAPARAAGALTHIDHVALTQPRHRFDEAVLFHRAVLGLCPEDSVDLADPHGLLHSRALSHADTRLVLNDAPAWDPQSRPDQHIALATDDIVTAARRLRAAGAGPLAIPANYYDHLAAHHDLDAAELDAYRHLGILYDRDEHGGEFRHFYTPAVGRVFFEVVQRTGGYRGYGAANAHIRLAAQRECRTAR